MPKPAPQKPDREITRAQVLAFRYAAQRLDRASGPAALVEVAAMGLHDPTAGTAGQALQARVEGLAPADVARALGTEKSLLRLWSLRMAPYVVPTADLPLFTTAIRPRDAAERAAFIQGAGGTLAEVGIAVDALVDGTAAGMHAALDGRALTKHQLVLEVADALARDLPPRQRDAWHQDPKYVDSRSVGEMLVAFALRIVALDGGFCHDLEGNFVRTDQWLGRPGPSMAPDAARAALLRRYLGVLGPSTPAHFAAWTNLGKPAAEAAFAALGDALVPVALGKAVAWLHADDLAAFEAAPPPAGVRLLPPYDPYLAGRDRAVLVPDLAFHKELWRAVGNPGVVLVDGEVAAAWKAKKAGKKLTLALTPHRPIPAALAPAVEAEAARLAPFRGAERAAVALAGR